MLAKSQKQKDANIRMLTDANIKCKQKWTNNRALWDSYTSEHIERHTVFCLKDIILSK